MRFAFVLGAVMLMGTGCLPKPPETNATPMIEVTKRGLAGRLALMDRYRLHDEDRKHMMQRPRVWVEEVPDEEVEESAAAATEEASKD